MAYIVKVSYFGGIASFILDFANVWWMIGVIYNEYWVVGIYLVQISKRYQPFLGTREDGVILLFIGKNWTY